MTNDIDVRPGNRLFMLGLFVFVYFWACSDSMAFEGAYREPFPELAVRNGYLVSHEEVKKRGGVGNYVFFPSGTERTRIELYREVGTFSTYHRDPDGALEIRVDRGALFAPDDFALTASGKKKLDKLSELIALEGISSPAVYTQIQELTFGSPEEKLASERARTVKKYLEANVVSSELVKYPRVEDSGQETRSTEVIIDE